ncbi:MAG: hypothetical protein ACJ8CR_18110, partial [Roseiflexaceae bacterium]
RGHQYHRDRIRAAVALTGSTPDSEAPRAVLTQQQQANQGLPPHLVMDQAGGWGKTRARVAALSEGQTSMVAWVPNRLFLASRFRYRSRVEIRAIKGFVIRS